jgi:hypothetical protein
MPVRLKLLVEYLTRAVLALVYSYVILYNIGKLIALLVSYFQTGFMLLLYIDLEGGGDVVHETSTY